MKSYSITVEPARHEVAERPDLTFTHYDYIITYLRFRNLCQELNADVIPSLENVEEKQLFVDAHDYNLFLSINE